MRFSLKIFLLAGIFLFSMVVNGQSQDVEVYVEPGQSYLGEEIRIFGFVKPNPGPTYARLELLKPVSGEMITEKVRAKSSGEYEFLFKETYEAGTWRVKVWKEGTNKYAVSSFVVSAGIFMAELVDDMEGLNEKTEEGFDYLEDLLKYYPVFPGKEEMEDKIDELLQKCTQMNKLLDQVRDAVEKMENGLKSNADKIPEPARKALRKAANLSVETSNRIKAEMPELVSILESSKKESEWCYIWLLYYEFCNKLNFINNFIASDLKGICQNLVVAEKTKGMPFPLAQSIGTSVHLLTTKTPSPLGFTTYMIGTIASLGSSIYGELLGNCTQYKGKVEGDYYAELLHKDAPFFTMSYKISGEIWLVFQKRKSGDPAVYLKGRFKGKAEDFECSITMVPFALPSSFTPAWCWSSLPLIAKRSFLLYLEGKAMDDSMEIKLEKVGYDFKLKSKAYYVILSSHEPLPIPGTLEFPLMNAEWFLTRVTEISNPKKEYFVLPIEVKGKKSVAEKDFEREIYLPPTLKRKAVRVKMKFKMKVCSPDCK
ncbi:MAG: hypothetical protein ACE5WD_13240 [Candidatus Aminicenantia bacterium]